MKKFIYPFAAFFVVLYILFSLNVYLNNTNDQGKVLSRSTTVKGVEQSLGPEELNAQYQEAAKSIVTVLSALTRPLEDVEDLTQRLESINRLNDTIFELRVPAQYQTLHIKLAAQVAEIERLLKQAEQTKNNQIDFNEVIKEFVSLTNNYSWLASSS